ncbi:MAG: hypothetical protein JNL08_09840 [Planctomycetes bacterium]|nr:hypothetical protein [Planctomycetota bacterium]
MQPARRTAAAAALLLAGCASAPRGPDVVVIPTGDGNLMRFAAGGVTVLDRDSRTVATYGNRAGTAPRGGALSLGSQLAVVAFERELALTDLAGTAEPVWVALPQPIAARGVAVDGDRCGLIDAAGQGCVVQLPAGRVTWQGRAGQGLDRVALLVPTGANEQVVVGQRGGEVVVQRLDFARGDGLITGETIVRDLNVLGAAGNAAGAVFLAGLRETSAASTRGALLQYLVLVRVDLATFRADVLQDEKCAALETRIGGLTVGAEMLAVVVDQYKRGTSLRVFDQVNGRRPATWAFERRITPGSLVAWLSPDYLAVVAADGATQVLHVVSDR